ncbi:MAG: acyl-phosphate glycerol 3-phosphate acyltransferase [Rhodobacterales bacterium]|nr:MAG: acyl-phosphate glycerol 3-phosphate acyltransferase [Rhodobacterales bacterium]
MDTSLLISLIFAYILGSVPFGIVWARVFGLGDLRQLGSGNIGATNVLRTGNKLAALLTFLGDAGKGAVAVLVVRYSGFMSGPELAGFAAMLGHCFPIFLRFHGGKGVATWFGTMFAISWPLGLIGAATWLGVAAIFRFSSLAGLTSVITMPVWAAFLVGQEAFYATAAMAVVITYRHKENIARLRDGSESRIGKYS